jgi:hypothetical protein
MPRSLLCGGRGTVYEKNGAWHLQFYTREMRMGQMVRVRSWVKRSDVMIVAHEDPFTTPCSALGDCKVLPLEVNVVRVVIMDHSYAESLAQKERQRPNSLN